MSFPLTSGRQYMLFLIKFTALCFCLYHLKYSDLFSNLKSAAKSIKVIFFVKCFEISCASPLGNAVKTISTSFKSFLLNLIIFGNFFPERDLS